MAPRQGLVVYVKKLTLNQQSLNFMQLNADRPHQQMKWFQFGHR